MKKIFKAIFRKNDGAAAVEFALVLPILIILAVPLADYFRYIMTLQKVNKIAASVADMVTMSSSVTSATTQAVLDGDATYLTVGRLTCIFNTVPNLAFPYPFTGTVNRVIVTSVYRPPGTAAGAPSNYVWQVLYRNGLPLTIRPPAAINAAAHPMPATFGAQGQNMFDNENAIMVRVRYEFNPIFSFGGGWIPILSTRIIDLNQVFMARNGRLDALVPNVQPNPPSPDDPLKDATNCNSP